VVVDAEGVACFGLRWRVFGFRFGGLEGVDWLVVGAFGEALGVGILDVPGIVEVVREEAVLDGALGIRLLAVAGEGLAGTAELNTQAVFGGVFVPPVFDVADDREEVLLFEGAISGSLGTGGAGRVGGAILAPFCIGRLVVLVALPVIEPCPVAELRPVPFPFD